MTREEYVENIRKEYGIVSVLSDNNGSKTLRLRNKRLNKDMILHSNPKSCPVYEGLCAVRCENLPLIYDVIEADDGQIVLEEYIDGLDLAQAMESGKYRYKGVKKVMKGICFALEVLHGQGYVHRDIKPENVLVTTEGRVVLIDFNASRQIVGSRRDTEILGTVGYAAPEQMGITESDRRTDVYALGVLMNVLLTGCHPSKRLAKGRAGRIVRKCTAVNPDDRYPTAEKFCKSL